MGGLYHPDICAGRINLNRMCSLNFRQLTARSAVKTSNSKAASPHPYW